MGDKSAKTTGVSKPRRKISLPWFRQSSFSPHSSFARQHTIDVPGSIKYCSFDQTTTGGSQVNESL